MTAGPSCGEWGKTPSGSSAPRAPKEDLKVSTSRSGHEREFEWVFFYWMPYDNDLWKHEVKIRNMLVQGVQSERILAVLASDLEKEKELTRRVITNGRVIHEEVLAVADSSSAQVYADNLKWLRMCYHTKRWAIVFLGHGGHLDEISPDAHPDSNPRSSPQWMNILDIARVLEAFNQRIAGRIELLFLQNCCKGTLEAIYTFRHAARYTLASQTKVGAPNYYYEGFFRSLGQNPHGNGSDIAQRLVSCERDDMYNGFALIDNAATCKLPARLDPLINAILSRKTRAHLNPEITDYQYLDDILVDVLSLFRSVVDQVGADQGQLDSFTSYLETELIVRHMISPGADMKDLCGLSIFFPRYPEDLDRYRYLDVYSDTRLAALLGVVMPFAGVAPGQGE